MNIFKDKRLNDEFMEFGFVKLSLFNRNECNTINKFIKKHIKENHNYTKNKIINGIPNKFTEDKEAIEIKKKFAEILKKKKGIFTENYDFISGIFFIKKKRSEKLIWHTDITAYDQKKYVRPFAIWSGVNKTTKRNGCFRVVPKSHKLAFKHEALLLGTINRDKKTKLLYNSLIDKYGIDVPLNKGEVIIHDQSIIHASYPNSSFFKNRVAFKLSFIPKDIHEFEFCVYNQKDNQYELYLTDKDYTKINFIKALHSYNEKNLIKVIKYEKTVFPFNHLSEMEKVMKTPISSLKSKFELF